jgi:hypothetical protein
MKVKASYKAINPFHPDPRKLMYSVTVNVPEEADMEELEIAAKEAAKEGYRFDKIEKVEE